MGICWGLCGKNEGELLTRQRPYLCGGGIKHLSFKKLSFLLLGTGVEEPWEGCQIYLYCFLGLPNFSAYSRWASKF